MPGLRQRRPRRGGGAGWVLWAMLVCVGMLVALTAGVLTWRLHLTSTSSSAHSDAGTLTSQGAASSASTPGFARFTSGPARFETLHIPPDLLPLVVVPPLEVRCKP